MYSPPVGILEVKGWGIRGKQRNIMVAHGAQSWPTRIQKWVLLF